MKPSKLALRDATDDHGWRPPRQTEENRIPTWVWYAIGIPGCIYGAVVRSLRKEDDAVS